MCNSTGFFNNFDGRGMMRGGGHFFMFPYAGIIITIIVIALIVFLILNLKPIKQSIQPKSNSALDILDREYATGKINTAEYQERKENLTK